MLQSQLATRSSASCWAAWLSKGDLTVGSSVPRINHGMVRLVIICEICAGAKLEGGYPVLPSPSMH